VIYAPHTCHIDRSYDGNRASLRGKWSGKCVKVADGDTITVQQNTKNVRIRLYGIDCPEGNQDFSKEAKQFTTKMVLDKIVELNRLITIRDIGDQ